MKKILTLLLVAFTAFANISNAQTGDSCNAGFQFTISGHLVHFQSSIVTDTAQYSHTWYLGDGSVSHYNSPLYNYANAGTYTVLHFVKRVTATGSVLCIDSLVQTVVISDPVTPCNQYANFTFTRDSIQPNKVYFHDLSTPVSNYAAHWNFGDGSVSDNHNPTHTFSGTGPYTVCLTVKRDSFCTDDTCRLIQLPVVPACNVTAFFTAHSDSSNTRKIYFNNQSTPLNLIDSIRWTFGDGTSSTDVNPVHTYSTGGTYNVCLRVKKNTPPGTAPCVSELCYTITVTESTCNLQANYSFFRDSLQPNKVYFTNTSIPMTATTTVIWSFGDGTASTDNSPTHVFPATGLYNVCLLVRKDSFCANEICRPVQIQVPSACNFTVNFTSQADSTNPSVIHFINQTTSLGAADSVRWTFGDGTSSADVNPTHSYVQPGTYQVCLRVKKYNGSTFVCTKDTCRSITITSPCNIAANYNYFRDSTAGAIPNSYHFNNTSTGVTASDSLFWNFGDGTPVVFNVNNPVHSFATPGTYHVCLLIKRAVNGPTTIVCAREECKTIVVTGTPNCNFVINFSSQADSLQPRKIRFTNLSQPPANAIVLWTFGDGTSSTAQNPVHEYAQAGRYNVCLKITVSNTCMKERCDSVVVTVAPPVCNIQSTFTATRDSLNHKKFHFRSTTVTPGLVFNWSFGDGTSASTSDPYHEYVQPGRYAVCLTVTLGNNCTSTGCDSVLAQATIDSNNCRGMAQFTFATSATSSLRYVFTPTVRSNDLHYFWNFGDGTSSQSMIAEHSFTAGSSVTVCLKVVRNNNCMDTSCRLINIIDTRCDSMQVSFDYTRQQDVPNKIHFIASSNTNIVQQRWTIVPFNSTTAPVIINQMNPTYLFTDTGNYMVCLRAVSAIGCVKESCRSVRIEQIAGNCELQAYPNPAHNNVSVNVQLQQPTMIHAFVYTTQNVLVKTKNQQGSTGNNIVQIGITDLPPGMYFIRLVYGNKVCIARFQKI